MAAQDLPTQDATDLWASQRAASTAAFDTPSKYAAWKTIPSWYFIRTGDKAITPQSELMMARTGPARRSRSSRAVHLTLISHPAAVVKVINSAIAAVS